MDIQDAIYSTGYMGTVTNSYSVADMNFRLRIKKN